MPAVAARPHFAPGAPRRPLGRKDRDDEEVGARRHAPDAPEARQREPARVGDERVHMCLLQPCEPGLLQEERRSAVDLHGPEGAHRRGAGR